MSLIIPVEDVIFVRLSDENEDAEDDVDEGRKADKNHRQSEPVSIVVSANVRGGSIDVMLEMLEEDQG